MPGEDWFKMLAMAGGVIAFTAGIYQYWRAQKWKRSEFVASEIKAMRSDPAARTMMQILDWENRRTDLFPDKQEGRWVVVTHRALANALMPAPAAPVALADENVDRSTEVHAGFTSIEARLRDLADSFLEHLDRFGHFVEVDLVTPEEFKPYLRYWFDLMADAWEGTALRQAPVWREALQEFISNYGYRGVMLLAHRMGYEMRRAPYQD